MPLPSRPMLGPPSPTRRILGACVVRALLITTAPAVAACGGATLPPPANASAAAAPRPASPAPNAVWVQLQPEAVDQRWTLVAKDQRVLCSLPCAQWISPGSEAFLEYERPGTTSLVGVGLPADLGPAGGSVVAVAHPARGSRTASSRLMFAGGSLALLGVIVLLGIGPHFEGGDTAPTFTTVGIAGGGALLLAGAGLYLLLTRHPPEVSVRAASKAPRATFAFGPGFVEVETAPAGGVDIRLTPLGATGTF